MDPDTISSPSRIQAWQTLSSTVALDEKWFTVRRDEVRLPSGTVLDDFFVWQCPHIVTVVPITGDGRFVLIRQYRHALGIVDLQFPAGAVDPGENADAAARRELEEETGYVGGELVPLYRAAPNAHKITGLEDIYLAQGVPSGGFKVDDENEPIQVVLATPEELATLIDRNEIHGATATLAGLLALRRLASLSARTGGAATA
jgi:ADP-ribose pyrophosphatase